MKNPVSKMRLFYTFIWWVLVVVYLNQGLAYNPGGWEILGQFIGAFVVVVILQYAGKGIKLGLSKSKDGFRFLFSAPDSQVD